MARFSRIEVAQVMKETGVIPVFYNADIEMCKEVVKACYDGGIRVFEFTNRGDYALEVFTALNKWSSEECPEMIMGVGSIIDEATTALYIAAGSNFIVSPILDAAMASVCNKRKVAWSPGCGTVSEVVRAHELGCEVVKIFPGSAVGGPDFVKGVMGPMPWACIMPTGGVSPDEANLTTWFKAGVHCVGMGSQLFPANVLAEKNYKFITDKCADALSIVKKLRA